MAKYTPMIEQYLGIKAEAGDALLFFRLGDFYEMFFEDALLAARELEITLTGRDGGAEERIPMCGVPYHAAEGYISRLVEKGYKVAICEQVENPAEAKGVVRREIVRIVTPGTIMEGKTIDDTANNFVASVTSLDGYYALAACDLTTGEIYVTSTETSLPSLLDELNVYAPSELVGDAAILQAIRASWGGISRPIVFTERTEADPALLQEQFDTAELQALIPSETTAAAILFDYLRETQKRSLVHLKSIHKYESKQYMTLDPFTRRNLELTETVRERSKKGSLLWLLDRTVTSMGGRMLRRWIDKPIMSKTRIEERLEAVDTLYNQLILREDLRLALKEIYDLERLVGRIAYGTANARDLLALRISLEQAPNVAAMCAASSSHTLQKLLAELDTCQDIAERIAAAIVDEPPVSVRDGGMIKPGYDTYLDQLREASTDGKRWLAELEQQEREATGIKSLKIGFNKVFGYYIEVTRSNLNSLPEGRYERKQTLANAERFVTPELKEKESLILEAEEKMAGLEYERFAELRDEIASQVHRLQQLASVIAEIDALQSFATVSAANRYSKPIITDTYDLSIKAGRHPVVEAVSEDGQPYMANDTEFSQDDGSVLLITGPNMAGKSTYMRQVALIVLMAQIGCFVPAERASVPIVDRIFTRIGAADDLIGGQSTFMVEMMDIQVMTAKATANSLIIIDELGRGTSTEEGMAIAQAVIEHIHENIRCKTLVSTHFHELAHLEDTLNSLRNYSMAVKESGDNVTFLRKLIRGAASSSYGIYCARIAGLPDTIIDRAYALISGNESRVASSESKRTVDNIREPIVQLSFFEEPPKKRDTGRLAAQSNHEPDPSARIIMDKLQTADLMNMTPMQAMNMLYELKQALKQDKESERSHSTT